MDNERLLKVIGDYADARGLDTKFVLSNWWKKGAGEGLETDEEVTAFLNKNARERIKSKSDPEKASELMRKYKIYNDPNEVVLNRKKIMEDYQVKGLGHLTDGEIAEISAKHNLPFEATKNLLAKASADYIAENAKKVHGFHANDTDMIRKYMAMKVNGGDTDAFRESAKDRPDLLAQFDSIDDEVPWYATGASIVNRYLGGGSVADAYAEHVANPDGYEGDYSGMARPLTADVVQGVVDATGAGLGSTALKAGAKVSGKVTKAVSPFWKSVGTSAIGASDAGATELARQAIAGEDTDWGKAGAVAFSQFTTPAIVDYGASAISSKVGNIPLLTPALRQARRGMLGSPEVSARQDLWQRSKQIENAVNGNNNIASLNLLHEVNPQAHSRIVEKQGDFDGKAKDYMDLHMLNLTREAQGKTPVAPHKQMQAEMEAEKAGEKLVNARSDAKAIVKKQGKLMRDASQIDSDELFKNHALYGEAGNMNPYEVKVYDTIKDDPKYYRNTMGWSDKRKAWNSMPTDPLGATSNKVVRQVEEDGMDEQEKRTKADLTLKLFNEANSKFQIKPLGN